MSTEKFASTSRYFGLETRTLAVKEGREIVYLARRFVPSPSAFALLAEHRIRQDERLDHIAFQQFGDAELFWRIADANGSLRPSELTENVGAWIRITSPEGVEEVTDE